MKKDTTIQSKVKVDFLTKKVVSIIDDNKRAFIAWDYEKECNCLLSMEIVKSVDLLKRRYYRIEYTVEYDNFDSLVRYKLFDNLFNNYDIFHRDCIDITIDKFQIFYELIR